MDNLRKRAEPELDNKSQPGESGAGQRGMSGTQPRKCPSDAGCNNVKSLFQEVGYNKSISLLNGERTIERGCKQNRIKKIVLTKRKIKRNVNKNQELIPTSIPTQRRSTEQQKLNLEDSHFSNAR